MITTSTHIRAQELQAAGASVRETARALGVSTSTVTKIRAGTARKSKEAPRCGGCRGKLIQSPCQLCRVRARQPAKFPTVPLPQGISPQERAKLERYLAEILPIRLVNTLNAAGIRTVNDLVHRRREELLGVPGFGISSLKIVMRALDRLKFDTSQAWPVVNRLAAQAARQERA